MFLTGTDGHIGDQYFFDSSDKVSFFFDTDAFDDAGNLVYPKEMAVNKIGHGLHMKDELYHDVTFDTKVKEIARSLDFQDPRVLQSMLIFKHPDTKGGERQNQVPPHTDGTFLYTKPQSAVGFWFALQDCTVENGCLSYNPGTHLTHPITSRFVKRNGGDDGCHFIPVDPESGLGPGSGTSAGSSPVDNPDDYKLLPCKAGSLVLINNSVLHKSENNRSKDSRFAYTFHVIEGKAEYDNLNWLQVPPGKEGGTEFSKLYEQ